jgi:argininosuccinate lyase
MPFRKAHHVVGAVVALAEKSGKKLNEVTLAELRGVSPEFSADAAKVFDLKSAMQLRKIIGAPGTAQVKAQLQRWGKQLAKRK